MTSPPLPPLAPLPEPVGYVTDIRDGATFLITDPNDIGIAVYGRPQLEAVRKAMVEWAASITENTEAGDGSHDYNAGAETMNENIARALRSSLNAAESSADPLRIAGAAGPLGDPEVMKTDEGGQQT